MKRAWFIFAAVAACIVYIMHAAVASEAPAIESGVCEDFLFSDIPVGDFSSPPAPETEMRITQKYNNSYEEGYCLAGGSYGKSGSAICDGRKIYYGHDGIDIHQSGAAAGANMVFAGYDGLVVVSHKVGTRIGWGETVIIATRASNYSQEIITHHYHHLFQEGADDTYTTSRRVNACNLVQAGSPIALEGRSGTGATHLHYSVRRWNNFADLQAALEKNGRGIYGYGYAFGSEAKLKKHLDPQSMLYHSFRDFEDLTVSYSWAFPDAVDLQQNGIEFGLWSGNFGALDAVKRSEIARWLKISAGLPNSGATVATFDDLPFTNKDCVYVESLTRWPELLPVVNPFHSCVDGARMFCPDDQVNKAEALKMVIMTFYSDEFFRMYDNSVWKKAFNYGVNLLNIFTDVDPLSWMAPYVLFGVQNSIVTGTGEFHPGDPVTRADVSRWIVNGKYYRKTRLASVCDSLICGHDQYCDRTMGECIPLSLCVPSETQQCEVGGGYVPDNSQSDQDSGSGGSPDAGISEPQCSVTYIASVSSSCYGNPQSSGSPVLCLEVSQQSGANFKYRICKQGGVFQNNFECQLKDGNNMVNFSSEEFAGGSACTPWKDFSVNYIDDYGASHGAGLIAEVVSPAGCADFACEYRTGEITIRKECE